MSNQHALRRFQNLYDKLSQLRNSADKEAYYYRKDEQLNTVFSEFADILNGAVSESRHTLRTIQTMNAYKTPAKKTAPKSKPKRK